jgi:hypothetical protein
MVAAGSVTVWFTWFFQRHFLVLGWFFGGSTILAVVDLDLCRSDGDVVLVL